VVVVETTFPAVAVALVALAVEVLVAQVPELELRDKEIMEGYTAVAVVEAAAAVVVLLDFGQPTILGLVEGLDLFLP
jgi:hypothetical protein